MVGESRGNVVTSGLGQVMYPSCRLESGYQFGRADAGLRGAADGAGDRGVGVESCCFLPNARSCSSLVVHNGRSPSYVNRMDMYT